MRRLKELKEKIEKRKNEKNGNSGGQTPEQPKSPFKRLGKLIPTEDWPAPEPAPSPARPTAPAPTPPTPAPTKNEKKESKRRLKNEETKLTDMFEEDRRGMSMDDKRHLAIVSEDRIVLKKLIDVYDPVILILLLPKLNTREEWADGHLIREQMKERHGGFHHCLKQTKD